MSNDEWDQCLAAYRAGELMSGDLKKIAAEYVSEFLAEHEQKREEAKHRIDEFLIKTPIRSVLELDSIPGLPEDDV